VNSVKKARKAGFDRVLRVVDAVWMTVQ
jgi:hypothetical protein